MQMNDAIRLQKEWGEKPCNHPNLDKEYHLGAATGDWVCTTCGASGLGRNWADEKAITDKQEK